MRTPGILVVAVLAAGLAAAGCEVSTTGSMPKAEVERQVTDELTKQVGQRPDKVECPEDLEAEVGTKMRCELTAGNQKYGVNLNVTSAEDDRVRFGIKVDNQPMS
ncbi:MAG: DUF4333 domain-containing protein [Pseudonocardiaceae bacterium]|nr:DUF4333 domain-containing protein [Pseudonocardiaceae bacterium]